MELGLPWIRIESAEVLTIFVLYNLYIVFSFAKKETMEFVRILEDGRLWAVKYDREENNCFDVLFSNWYDMNWLKNFFEENLIDHGVFDYDSLNDYVRDEQSD